MMGRMNRPQSAPSRAVSPDKAHRTVGIVGRAVGGGEPAAALGGQRAEYRPRARGAASGAGVPRTAQPKTRERVSSAARRRREVVHEYMRCHVDPLMQGVITHLLVAQPRDVPVGMLIYLRALRDGAAPAANDGTSSRKVGRADRVYMVQHISPTLTELLGDVVKARPRAPIDFMIAWLASKAVRGPAAQRPPALAELDAAADEAPPQPSVRSKLRDAVSFDAQVQKDLGAPAARGEPAQRPPPSVAAAPPPAPEEAPASIARKTVLVVGPGTAGKTTLLKALKGDLEPACKPTSGVSRTNFPGADADGNPDGTAVCFVDLSGAEARRATWYACFAEMHAVIFVVDAAGDLAEARAAFDAVFRPSAAELAADPQRGMALAKPLLVVANKQDAPGAASADAVAAALDLAQLQASLEASTGTPVALAVCAAICQPMCNGGEADVRLGKAVEWLAARVDDDTGALTGRLAADQAIIAAIHRVERDRKEARVFRKTMRKAFPQDGAAVEECFTPADGDEFIAAELGFELDLLPQQAKELARTVNYQKLAMSLVANMKNPINAKKRAALDWPEITDYVQARIQESWTQHWVDLDWAEDPANKRKLRK